MKKIALILVIVLSFLCVTSCDIGSIMGQEPDENESKPGDEVIDDTETGENGDEDNDTAHDKKEDEDSTEENTNSDLVCVNDIVGLNEQIYISLVKPEGDYKIFYRSNEDDIYSQLDENLILESNGNLDCYILGIKSGKYQVKIEAEIENKIVTNYYNDIEVEAQDRSGYAHFGSAEGIGAYNNDGTVKEDAIIIYVTNDNKNTISMTIGDTEYIGLVNILQAQHQAVAPLLIRVIGKITTNQWNYKNVAPRLADGSNADDSFFDNTFSTEYGENLANLRVQYSDKKDGKTYIYSTTSEGLSEPRVKGGSKGTTTTYKGSDFPELMGLTVYEDDSFINMISVQAAKNITIEGIGNDAEFFQFGIGFEECNSIEIKNISFTNYPEDALNFIGKDDVTLSGRYWIHNNTFNRGYNAWDITGERDKYAGDGSIDLAIVHSLTLAYNKFDSCKKTMLAGNGDSSRCLNISIHHNHFYNVGSRLPLSRNANIHSYNNYFESCLSCASVRVNSYLFSEANYYYNCSKPFEISGSAVKSYGDIFLSCGNVTATVADSRDQVVKSSCKPDLKTDYSKFDTDEKLFYYDAEQGVSDVSVMLNAEDLLDFVIKYAGVGCKTKLVLS